jgi:predicted  nucleic acid-binding Zn-ribbon protein
MFLCVFVEDELRTELEKLVCLERQFADWEKQMESELAVSQRISEKTKADNKQLTKEMQKQVLQFERVVF